MNHRSVNYDYLERLIREIFPECLTYLEGTQLCIILFCISFQNVKDFELSKEELAILFSRLVIKKMISIEEIEYRELARELGVDKFSVNTYEHWLAICLSVLKLGNKAINDSVRDQLICKIEEFRKHSSREK